MKQYTGKSLEEIIEVVAIEKGIDQSLIYHQIVSESEDEVVANIYLDEDVIVFIEDYLDVFFENIEQDVYIDVRLSEGIFRVNMNAKNNAIIIGKAGQTLQSLTTVVRGAVNAKYRQRFQIVMDVNNYKANRYEKVQSMVYRIAKEVQESKIDATLDFMPSDERRVVHNYLNGMENIDTESIGEGASRRLVIKYISNE